MIRFVDEHREVLGELICQVPGTTEAGFFAYRGRRAAKSRSLSGGCTGWDISRERAPGSARCSTVTGPSRQRTYLDKQRRY